MVMLKNEGLPKTLFHASIQCMHTYADTGMLEGLANSFKFMQAVAADDSGSASLRVMIPFRDLDRKF